MCRFYLDNRTLFYLKDRGGNMPKKKTRKAVAKRFKVSAGGKVLYKKSGTGHLFTGKSRRRKRRLRKKGVLGVRASRWIAGMIQK